MQRHQHENDRAALLFILTGDSRPLPKSLKPDRATMKKWALEGKRPADCKPPKRFKRSNPANPYINEAKVKAKDPKIRSHSHRIEELAKSSGRVYIMSNTQEENPVRFGQSPSHRNMSDDERTGKISPKVGPQNK